MLEQQDWFYLQLQETKEIQLLNALENLNAGGSTAGGAGIQLA